VRVADARPRERRDGPEGSGQGVVHLACQLLNQRDEVVQEGVLTELIRTRQTPGSSSS
jgi:acyl dehydratase